MPLIHCNFYSEALQLSTSLDVILPLKGWENGATAQSSCAAPSAASPVLYLLHGLSDDQTIWQRRTSIERYADPLNLAVVMPAVNRSFYTDMASGLRYWTFISEEVPYVVHSLFHLSTAREDTFVAGLSMGGYGAFKLALSHPERFAAAASLSGAVDMARAYDKPDPNWKKELCLIFGDPSAVAGSDNDLFALAKKLKESGQPQPNLYQWCGTEDFLIESNHRFRDMARKLKLELDYSEGPGGHEWRCWDDQIQRVLQWIQTFRPLSKETNA